MPDPDSAADLDASDVAVQRFADAAIALHGGDLGTASARASEALARFRESCGDDHPDVANTLTLLSRIARTASQFLTALAHAETAVLILDEVRAEAPDEPIVVRLLADATAQHAAALLALARPDAAAAALAPLLVDLEQLFGSDDDEVATFELLLAVADRQQGRWDDAARRLARAVDVIAARHGPDSGALASLEHQLGALDLARGEPARAELHARRAIELREASLGADHPAAAADRSAWAAALTQLGRTDEAETACRRALAILVAAYGEVHHEVGLALGRLGAVHARQQRSDDARAALDRALAIQRELLADDHPEVASLREQLSAGPSTRR
jgi:tetratricopeptide (TPR) repeat protein